MNKNKSIVETILNHAEIVRILVENAAEENKEFVELYFKSHKENKKLYDKQNHYQFEEDDSFFDHNGDEHIIDEDRYCEDCDDYHDDY